MSFELETESITICEPIKTANVKAVIDTDIIVPDTKPDVLNILQVNALSSITEKNIQKDSVSVRGYVDYCVLYSAGDENIEVKSINYRTPFLQNIDAAGIDNDMLSYVTSNVSHIEFHIQNSRKINIKSVVDFDTGAFSKVSISAASSFSTELNLPAKNEEISSLELCVCTTNDFALDEEVQLSIGSLDMVCELLKTDVHISNCEEKVMNNKVVLKGSLIANTLYSIDGDIYHVENEIPFTEVLDVEDISPQMHTEIIHSVTQCQSELITEEEENYLRYNITVSNLIKAFKENTYPIISDVYSPDFQSQITTDNVKLIWVKESLSKIFSVNEIITLATNMPAIVKVYNFSAVPTVTASNTGDSGGVIEGYIAVNLLYLSDSKAMPVYSFSQKIPFRLDIDSDTDTTNTSLEAMVSLEHVSYTLKSDRDIEIRAALKAQTKFVCSVQKEIITDISVDEGKPLSKEKQAGLTIYFADENETLWDIAKRYNTTISEITSINNISETDTISNRQQLLIPKRVAI